MDYKRLKGLLFKHECKYPKSHLTAYITFSSFGPGNKKEYPWKSRTYLVSSDNKAFQPNKGGYSIFGSCLDGTDRCVRLEQRMQEELGGKDGWVVEDCGIVVYLLIECSDLSISTPALFYTHSDAQEHMLRQLSEKGDIDFDLLKRSFADTKDLLEDGVYGTHDDSAWFADRDEDWHWQIQPVCIYGPLKMVFLDQDRYHDVGNAVGNTYPAPPGSVQGTALAVPETAECPPSPSAAEVFVMNGDRANAIPPADATGLNDRFPREDWGEYFWGFTCFSRQDYAKTVPLNGVDEITLGVQCAQGGCLCELTIRWHMIGNAPVPKLEMFDEAWPLFQAPTFVSVLEQLTQMSRNHALTPDEVSALLIAHGFTDQSDRPLETANG